MDRRLITAIASFVILGGGYGIIARKIDKAPRDEAWFWVNKVEWRDQFDIVIAGDSRTNRGVDPSQIESEIPNSKIANFALSGQGWSSDYLQRIPQLLTSTGKKIIMLGIDLRSFTDMACNSGGFANWGFKPKFELWSLKTFSKIEMFTTSENPILLFGRALSSGAGKYVQGHTEAGWMSTQRSIHDTESAQKEYRELFKTYQPRNENIERLRVTISKWRESGYQIFIFKTPISQEINNIETQLSTIKLESIEKQLEDAGAIHLENNSNPYETIDGHHLDKESAERYSKFLGQQLSAALKNQVSKIEIDKGR